MDPQPIIEPTMMFTSVGDLFIFLGLLVSIGCVGVIAIYKLIREIFYGD